MKRLIFIVLLISIFLLGYFSFEKKVEYDKYAKVEIENSSCFFDTLLMNKIYSCNFKITNTSNNPFYIIDIVSSEKVNFLDTKIKKIIDKGESTIIHTQFKVFKKGNYENNILIESNSHDKIIFKIKGYVR